MPLTEAAEYMALLQGPTGEVGHTDPNGQNLQNRVERFTTSWEETIGENIMYNSQSPLEALINLAVDDGLPNRGHRNNILNPFYYYTGVSTQYHKNF